MISMSRSDNEIVYRARPKWTKDGSMVVLFCGGHEKRCRGEVAYAFPTVSQWPDTEEEAEQIIADGPKWQIAVKGDFVEYPGGHWKQGRQPRRPHTLPYHRLNMPIARDRRGQLVLHLPSGQVPLSFLIDSDTSIQVMRVSVGPTIATLFITCPRGKCGCVSLVDPAQIGADLGPNPVAGWWESWLATPRYALTERGKQLAREQRA